MSSYNGFSSTSPTNKLVSTLKVPEEAFNSYCYISSTFTLPAEGITSHMYPGVQPHHGRRPSGWSNRMEIRTVLEDLILKRVETFIYCFPWVKAINF